MIPDPLGREAARDLARDELTDPGYAEAQPSLAVRLVARVVEAVQDLFDRASANVPGGRGGLVLVLLVLAALVVLLLVKVRPARSASATVFGSTGPMTADEHRARADAFAADGEHAEAVRERLRAVVRDLEDRGVLDPRPGRTADEVAQEAGRRLPEVAGPLRRGTTVFDEVWYGGRPADAASYAVLVEVDAAVRAVRAVVA